MKKNAIRFWCIGLVVLICIGTFIVAVPAVPDYEKVLEIHLSYQDGKFELLSQQIVYGTPPNLAVLSGPIRGVISDTKGDQLEVFHLSPLGSNYGEVMTGPSGTSIAPYTVHSTTGKLDFNIPVFDNMKTLSLYDTGTASQLFSLDVDPAFTTFCLGYPQDPDCLARASLLSPEQTWPDVRLVVYGIILTIIIIAALTKFLANRTRSRQPDLESRTILVVDDSPDILDVVYSSLTRDGFRCLTASGGKECLDILSLEKPDVIILDVVMAPMDGWMTLREIKSNHLTESIPVLMLTASRLTARDAREFHISIEDYIQKPFQAEEVGRAVEQILTRKKALRQSLALAEKAGVDRDTFCKVAALSRRITNNRKIISILQRPDPVTEIPGIFEPGVKEFVSELKKNSQNEEVQLEKLKTEIRLAFTRKGFAPPSW